MISLAARVVAPREEMMEVANTYVPITITLLIDSASPDCTERHQQSGNVLSGSKQMSCCMSEKEADCFKEKLSRELLIGKTCQQDL